MTEDADAVFELFGLTEYETTALEELLALGQTTAPNLAEATGIPKARVYGVLDGLADRGFINIIPGRPKEYQAKPPGDILDRAIDNQKQEYEAFAEAVDARKDAFLDEYGPKYERATGDISPASELFHVVDVGTPSERETRRIYRNADQTLKIITNSFAYFENVEQALSDVVARGIEVSVIFIHPDILPESKAAIQAEIVDEITSKFPRIELKFSPEKLPWRGAFIDPSMEYDSGKAILLVEEPSVPDHNRQAAITENGSFVAGMNRYFDLIWEHEATWLSKIYE
jgi:sugar-specific transcriptional regulator TrmB